MKIKKDEIIILVLMILFLPVLTLAKIGVGVGLGKVSVDQPLKPGLIYTLPPLPVLNTGDEPGDYSVSIEYHEGQEKNPLMGLRPPKEWFSFDPQTFHLEPGQVKQVQIKLTLPLKGVKPGNYFAYLEAHPIKQDIAGLTTIGVAAASKLYFTVKPANILVGIYYRINSLIVLYSPLSYVILGIISAVILIGIFRRFFSLQIGISLKKK